MPIMLEYIPELNFPNCSGTLVLIVNEIFLQIQMYGNDYLELQKLFASMCAV